MGWLEFIAAIVASLAWPIVAVTAVILFRKPVVEVLQLLRRIKFRDFELEFEREIQELQQEAAAALPLLPPGVQALVPEEQALLQLVTVSPRAAIAESWRLVEVAARRAIESRSGEIDQQRPLTGPNLLRALRQREILDEAGLELLQRIRILRNEAVHAEQFQVESHAAREYVDLALAIVRRLKAAAP